MFRHLSLDLSIKKKRGMYLHIHEKGSFWKRKVHERKNSFFYAKREAFMFVLGRNKTYRPNMCAGARARPNTLSLFPTAGVLCHTYTRIRTHARTYVRGRARAHRLEQLAAALRVCAYLPRGEDVCACVRRFDPSRHAENIASCPLPGRWGGNSFAKSATPPPPPLLPHAL